MSVVAIRMLRWISENRKYIYIYIYMIQNKEFHLKTEVARIDDK